MEAYFIQRDAVLALLRNHFLKAQTKIKTFAHKHRTYLVFTMGNWVFIKLKPYRQLSMWLQKGHKLG